MNAAIDQAAASRQIVQPGFSRHVWARTVPILNPIALRQYSQPIGPVIARRTCAWIPGADWVALNEGIALEDLPAVFRNAEQIAHMQNPCDGFTETVVRHEHVEDAVNVFKNSWDFRLASHHSSLATA